MSKPTRLFQCSGCRQRKEIVKHSKGMSFCESCAAKAPSAKEFFNYVNEHRCLDSNSVRPKQKEMTTGWAIK